MESVKKYRSYLFGLFIVIAILLGIVTAYLFKNGIFLQHPIVAICLLLVFLFNAIFLYAALYVISQFDVLNNKLVEKHQEDDNLINQVDNSIKTESKVNIQVTSEDILLSINQCKNKEEFSNRVLINLSKHIEIVTALFYARNQVNSELFDILGSFAYFSTQNPQSFTLGEGLAGQVIKNKKPLSLSNVPDGYVTIVSGLGNGSPRQILFIPLIYQGEVYGLMELAAFKDMNFDYHSFFEKECENITEQFLKFAN